jgi:ribonucleoside-diphosphate reductase beta chain
MLLETRDYYKPFEYPWAFEAYKAQKKMEWHPEEVPLADDIKDYNNKLSPENRKLITQIFRFFTQGDVDVAGGYCQHYLPTFKPPEVRMMMAAFASMEATHIEAYSLLIETLGLSDDEYKMFNNFKAMREKHEYLQRFNMETPENIAKSLAVYSGFTEGVQLFSSFAILLNFPRHNLMKNMGQIVSWSVRDENLHVEGMTRLFRTYIEENPHLWTDALKSSLYSIAERIVELEDAFIDTCFEGASIPGLVPNDVKMYIRYIAGRRLNQLGLKNIFYVNENPLPWVDAMINAVEHTNFFENRPTEYAKASTTGNWEDIF